MKKTWKFVGINFDHMHMGDLLKMVHTHPDAEIAGICDEDPNRMQNAIKMLGIAGYKVFTDMDECLAKTGADVAILCASTAEHADYVERIAPHGVHLLVEKPFAASVKDADRMMRACGKSQVRLMINWPLRWVPSHCTAYRLVTTGAIGQLEEVHYYSGNRGPLYHTAGKVETRPTAGEKQKSWFYSKAKGGGSLLDYLGYGVTLGTWFHQGRRPTEVTAAVYGSEGLEVDEQSITIARYDRGLSKFETRWGTFTDPWTHQPQPKCGFVLKGTGGTISSYDYEPIVTVQTKRNPKPHPVPAADLKRPFRNPVEYLIRCLEKDLQIDGPLSPAISRIGQEIVDAAMRSAKLKRTVKLT